MTITGEEFKQAFLDAAKDYRKSSKIEMTPEIKEEIRKQKEPLKNLTFGIISKTKTLLEEMGINSLEKIDNNDDSYWHLFELIDHCIEQLTPNEPTE